MFYFSDINSGKLTSKPWFSKNSKQQAFSLTKRARSNLGVQPAEKNPSANSKPDPAELGKTANANLSPSLALKALKVGLAGMEHDILKCTERWLSMSKLSHVRA